jgi:hypothetical protein
MNGNFFLARHKGSAAKSVHATKDDPKFSATYIQGVVQFFLVLVHLSAVQRLIITNVKVSLSILFKS